MHSEEIWAGLASRVWTVVGVGVCVYRSDRSPSYTNFFQPNIGSKSQKFSRRFAPKLLLRTLQKRIKIAKKFSALRAEIAT